MHWYKTKFGNIGKIKFYFMYKMTTLNMFTYIKKCNWQRLNISPIYNVAKI